MKPTRIEISAKTIVFTVLFLLFLWALYEIRSILVLFFISFIMATAINPLATVARRKKIPIVIPIFIVYLIILLTLSLAIASLVPAFLSQSKSLVDNIPRLLGGLESELGLKFSSDFGSSYVTAVPSNILRFAGNIFGNILNIFAIFFISYYIIESRPRLHRYLAKFIGDGDAERRAEEIIVAVERVVGGWVRGELILMLVIGVMTYVGLILLGIPYALPLAVIAGMLEIVPNLGPTIAAIPPILMGLTISPVTALGALAVSIIVQQLENNLIVPKVMQSQTGAHPLVTILVLLSGFALAGVAGAVLAMPLYLTAATVYKYLTK